MSRIISLILSMFLCANIFAQKDSVKRSNAVFIELGGVGGFYSFNYQRNINLNKHWGINVGVGFSPQSTHGFLEYEYMPDLPFQLKAVYKINNKHSMNLGVGGGPFNWNFFYAANYEYDIYAMAQFGYQYDFSKNNFFLGISFTPYFYDTYHYTFSPYGGLRFGYNFNKIEHKAIATKGEEHSLKTFSGIIGPINPKIRMQYEKAHSVNTSRGIQLTAFIGRYDFPGIKAEVFSRRYAKESGTKEGVFLQGKVGVGYFSSQLYAPYIIDHKEKEFLGFIVGGGIASGYKWMIGNHLILESILGVHYYTPPMITQKSNTNIEYRNEKWYNTTGMPIDFQFKIGWQY